MTKHDIVLRVSEKAGLSRAQAADVVEIFLASIIDSLSREERVELRNFGIFEVRRRKSRMGRNPADPSKEYLVPARAVAKFKPGKQMAAAVGRLPVQAAARPESPS